MSHIRQISNEDNDKIIKLLYKSFGPGRFARSVYRLREKMIEIQSFLIFMS